MKLEIKTKRTIISLLLSGGNSLRGIANLTGVSHQTVMRVRDTLTNLEITKDELKTFDDLELKQRITKKIQRKKQIGDWVNWSAVHDAHKQNKIPLSELWTELKQTYGNDENRSLSVHQFRRAYKKWYKKQHISMRQLQIPGDKIYLDFCGQTFPIYNATDGSCTRAQIFVGVLSGSGLIFAYAVESQKSKDWLKCHVEMFAFFGGVASYLVPDNLKSATTKNTSTEIIINRAYQELAEHYATAILPARVRKPKDKSLAEIGVRIIQNWLLWSIRDFKFFSINELNKEIRARLATINNKKTKTYPESRMQRFLNIEKSKLHELPSQKFEIAEWVYNKKVGIDYHFEFDGRWFSVPFQYANSHVDLKITDEKFEIFSGNKRIAAKSLDPSISGTDPSHMPPNHKVFHDSSTTEILVWASQIGEATQAWCKHHIENKRNFANGMKSIHKLKKLVLVEKDDKKIEACCAFAISLKNFSFGYLSDVVKMNLHNKPVPTKTSWIKDHENIRGASNYIDIGA